MALKKGNELPKRGNSLPLLELGFAYEQVISAALRQELGRSRYTAKTLMRWTGAGARAAKHWLAGSAGPSGVHLIALMRNSDAVFEAVLKLAGRDDHHLSDGTRDAGDRMVELRGLLESAMALTSNGRNG
jgi:hypothetical protein